MKILFASFLLFSLSAQALVDMKNANFSDYWVDIILPGKKTDLKIDRTYSSRSLFSGIFGFGWCSSLEVKIDITLEGNLVLNECDGLAINFYPANYNTKLINTSVNKITALLKKKYINKTDKYFEDLKKQMRSDHKLRSQLAGEVGFKIPTTKNSVFLANGKEIDKISFDGRYYIRTLPDRSMQKFDSDGRLVYLYDQKKNYLKISYKDTAISHVSTNEGLKVTFIYGTNNKIKSIVGPNKVNATYIFSSENLIQVNNGWNNLYTYKYDSNHNLTHIKFPDKTSKTIVYNEKKDWVEKFIDRDGCVEDFNFVLSNDNPKDHYWSTAVKKCKKKVKNKSRYEFWYALRPDKEKYLSRVLSERNNDTVDISYHKDFGKPVSIRKNADLTTLEYYDNGLVKKKIVSALVVKTNHNLKYSIFYKYDNYNKVKESLAEYFGNKGKTTKKVKTNYKYDPSGRLVSAKNSIGQYIVLKYNNMGLIASIEDQAKKEIQIKYNSAMRKPSSIIRPAVGSIQVIYDSSGRIKSVKNKGGSSVATQVADAFNNFIEIIGPATTELNINL